MTALMGIASLFLHFFSTLLTTVEHNVQRRLSLSGIPQSSWLNLYSVICTDMYMYSIFKDILESIHLHCIWTLRAADHDLTTQIMKGPAGE